MAYGARLESGLGRESLESSNLSPSANSQISLLTVIDDTILRYGSCSFIS